MAALKEIFVKIGADVKDALRGLSEVETQVKGMSKVAFRGLTVATAAAGAGAAVSAKQFIDYEQSLANIQTIMAEGEDVTTAFDAAIKSMSVELSASGGTAEVASGLYEVLSAETLQSSEALAVLETAMKAAKAGMADTQSAVQLLTGVSKAFTGTVSAEMTQRISDLAFETVKLGQTTFPELASSMGQLAPIAAAAGVSLEEMFGLTASLTGVTGGTSEVVTQLRSAITALLKPSADMARLMRPIIEGLSAQGKLAPEVASKYDRLWESMQQAESGGEVATKALAAIDKKVAEAKANLIDAQKSAGDSTGPFAIEAAQDQIDAAARAVADLKKQLKAAKSADAGNVGELESALAGAEGELQAARDGMEALTDQRLVDNENVKRAKAALAALLDEQSSLEKKVKSSSDSVKVYEEELSKLMETLGPQILANHGLAGTYQLLKKSADDLGIGLASAVGRVEAYNAVVALTGQNSEATAARVEQVAEATGTTDKAFATMTDTAASGMQRFKNTVQVAMLEVGAEVVDGMERVVAAFREGFGDSNVDVIGTLKSAVQGLTSAFEFVAFVVGKVSAFFAEHETLAKLLAGTIAFLTITLAAFHVVMSVGTPIVAAFGVSMDAVALPVLAVVAAIAAVIIIGYLLWKHWDELTAFMKNVWDKAVSFVQDKWDAIKRGVAKLVEGVKNAFAPLGVLVDYWTAWWDTIKAVLAAVFLTIVALFKGDTGTIKEIWSAFGDRLKEIWGGLWESVWTKLTTAFGDVKDFFAGGWKQLAVDALVALAKLAVDVGVAAGNIVTSILGGIGNIGQTVKDWFIEKMSAFTAWLTSWAKGEIGMSPTLLEIGASIVSSLLSGIGSMITSIGSSVVKVAQAIKDSIIPSKDDMISIGQNAAEYLADGFARAKAAVARAASKIAETVRDFFPASPPKRGPLRDPVEWAWMAEGMDDLGRTASRRLTTELGALPELGVVARGGSAIGVGGGGATVTFQPGSIVVNGGDRNLLPLIEEAVRRAAVQAVDARAGQRRRESGVW